MIAIETTSSGRAREAWLALEALANPKAAHRRRKADRLAALAKEDYTKTQVKEDYV